MNTHEEDRMKLVLKQALPPVPDAEPNRDLWPDVLRRVGGQPAAPPPVWIWFDWALAGSLVAFAAFVPASIPVLLYYL